MGAPVVNELTLADVELENHVRGALKAAVQGDNDFYDQLLGVIHQKEYLSAEEVALLVTCLRAISGAVSSIDIVHHHALLAAVLRMSLWDYEIDVMDVLVEFIVSLASSSGDFVDLCLEMLVSNFMPRSTYYSEEYLKKPLGLDKKRQVLDRVHSTLINIATVVPFSPVRLGIIVKDKMPSILQKEHLMSMYVENILMLEAGVMGNIVGRTVLMALVDRLIELDVELTWDDILQDDFCKGIFDMDLEDLEGHVEFHNADSSELTREALFQSIFCGNNMVIAEKLDSLLVLTFEHLQSCYNSGRLSQVFETLILSFKKTILTAYKSKFAQFIMFYACSLDPENCGEFFANEVCSIFLRNENPEWRMSAVAYLASYLSRAKFLSATFVATILESVVEWCFQYCKVHEGVIYPKNRSVFYAGCQAIMYVLCFRMKQMLVIPRFNSGRLLKRIEDILGHPLKPMQACLPSIVEEFVELTHKNGLFPSLETFVCQSHTNLENCRTFGGVQRLDMFFPFDPCLLRKSDRYIHPNYVYWSMVRNSYEDDEHEVIEEKVEVYDGFGEFACSLDKMSITPRPDNMLKMPSRIRPSMSPESL